MHLVAPDILQEAQGLSPLPCIIAMIVGFILWLWGWKTHRFWLVFATTLSAGIYGLIYGPAHGTPSLVAGLLMAIAAGALALDVIRLLAFIGGGVMGLMIAQQLAPNWNEPLLFCFLGGFLALLLYRYWMMAMFSFVGSMLSMYGGLCLWHSIKKIDIIPWSQEKAGWLDSLIIASTVVGLMIQFYFDRKQRKKSGKGLLVVEMDEGDDSEESEKSSSKWIPWPFGKSKKSKKGKDEPKPAKSKSKAA